MRLICTIYFMSLLAAPSGLHVHHLCNVRCLNSVVDKRFTGEEFSNNRCTGNAIISHTVGIHYGPHLVTKIIVRQHEFEDPINVTHLIL
jgi:hypothetical protein